MKDNVMETEIVKSIPTTARKVAQKSQDLLEQEGFEKLDEENDRYSTTGIPDRRPKFFRKPEDKSAARKQIATSKAESDEVGVRVHECISILEKRRKVIEGKDKKEDSRHAEEKKIIANELKINKQKLDGFIKLRDKFYNE